MEDRKPLVPDIPSIWPGAQPVQQPAAQGAAFPPPQTAFGAPAMQAQPAAQPCAAPQPYAAPEQPAQAGAQQAGAAENGDLAPMQYSAPVQQPAAQGAAFPPPQTAFGAPAMQAQPAAAVQAQYGAQVPPYIQAEDARQAERRLRRRSFGAGWLYFGIYLGGQLIAGIILGVIVCARAFAGPDLLRFDPSTLIETLTEQVMALSGVTALVANLLALLILFIVFRARKCRFLPEVGLRNTRALPLLLLVPLGFLLNAFVSSVLSMLPVSALESYSESSGLLAGMDPLTIISVVLVAPLTEEIVFRGLIYDRFHKGLRSGFVAILLASLLFGLMHGQWLWICYAGLLGMLLCLLYRRSQSLLPAIVLHVSFNAASYVLMLLPDMSLWIMAVGSGALSALLIALYFRTVRRPEAYADGATVR